MTFTGKTKNLGIIGYPIEHSLSPAIQGAAIETAGIDYSYIAMPVSPEKLSLAVTGLASLGFSGFNVTIPHKVAIMDYLDEIDESARMIGAVNTVAVRDGKLYGYNTDCTGFMAPLHKQGVSMKGKRAVLLGAGGAARAIIWGLIMDGVQKIEIGVRNPEKVEPLVAAFRKHVTIEVKNWEDAAFERNLELADLIVNTTPLGMSPHIDEMPRINWDYVNKETFIYDIIYVPQMTKFLQMAQQNGNPVLNGEGMLVEQGAAAFKIWTGCEADVEVMTKALRAYLRNL